MNTLTVKCSQMFFRMPKILNLTPYLKYKIILFQGNVIVNDYSKGNVIIPLFPKNQGHYSTAKISVVLIPLFLFSPRIDEHRVDIFLKN